jgi:hypothetical protein
MIDRLSKLRESLGEAMKWMLVLGNWWFDVMMLALDGDV